MGKMYCSRKERLGRINFFFVPIDWDVDQDGYTFYRNRPKAIPVPIPMQADETALKDFIKDVMIKWNTQYPQHLSSIVHLAYADIIWIPTDASDIEEDPMEFIKLINALIA